MAEQTAPSPITAEIQALITLAGDWVRSVLPESEIASGAPECAHCPVCRLVRALRADSPQLREGVASGVDGAVTAINAVLLLLRSRASHADGDGAPSMDDAAPPAADGRE